MSLLPARTQPWRGPFRRRHSPAAKRSYRDFRQCLRWEFGFSCCVCLAHETDLFEHGVEGTALMHVEHREPRSTDPGSASRYSNCLLVCRLCNLARGALPLRSPSGAHLLGPTEVAWVDHFDLDGDRLIPRAGDSDALYTHEAYDLDDPMKVAMRQFRRTRLTEWLQVLKNGPSLRDRLLEKGIREKDPELIAASEELDDAVRRAWRDLLRFQAIPRDAALSCNCSEAAARVLPAQLGEQTQALPPLT